MKDLKERLLSRKFWLTVAAFITLIATNHATEAMGVVLGYLGIEGYADAKSRAQ